jgi:biopolymer transport protein ExbD
MALNIRKGREIKPNIPTASMADITFMLIIFFVLTTTFSVDKTTVDLPDSISRHEAAQQSALVLIHIEYDRSSGTAVPAVLHYRYSDGMLQSWEVGEAIELRDDPSLDTAYLHVRNGIIPTLKRDILCTLNPQADSGDGRSCAEYMLSRNPKIEYPRDDKGWRDFMEVLRTKRFIIKAGRRVPYRFVDPVIQALRDNNAFEVFLLTEEKALS